MDVYLLLENEVIGGHIDILIVDYLEDEKVKTLIASPQPYEPYSMRRRLPTPLFPTFFRLVRTPPEVWELFCKGSSGMGKLP